MSPDVPSLKEIRAAIASADVPTTPRWRELMRSKRRTLKMSQTKLAQLVNAHQTTISELESGRVLGSKHVPAIAVALRIPPPHIAIQHELEERLIRAGRSLLAESQEKFERWLRFIEDEAETLNDKSGKK